VGALSQVSGNTFFTGTSLWEETGNNFNAMVTKVDFIDEIGLAVKIRDISIGTFHAIALDIFGRLWCWGDNRFGQCGIPNTPKLNKPTLME